MDGVWKINVDDAFCVENMKGAWGFIARNASIGGVGCIEVVKHVLLR